MILTVDPGKKSLAIAWGSEQRLLGCYNAKIGETCFAYVCVDACSAVEKCIRNYEGATMMDTPNKKYPIRLYVEQPIIRQGANVNQQDILDLSCIAASCLCTRPLEMPIFRHFVKPHEWKGTVPKDIHNQRVISKLSPAEYKIVDAVAGLTRRKHPDHNIIDAVGIYMYAQGRLVPRRG